MNIRELFRRLSFGELSNLSISGEGSGTIEDEKKPQIIQYTNEGLLRLFSRFTLKENDLILEQVGSVTNYYLRRQYSEMASAPYVKHRYIKDLPGEPFTEDVIQVPEVFHESGRQLPLNDKERLDSLFTPQPDLLQIPDPRHGEPLSVLYRARHEPLIDAMEDELELLEQPIDLPFFLEGALTAFIGHKTYSHMNGQENLIKSQEYLNTFEAICLDVETRDLVNNTFSTSHHKLHDRGFV